MLRSKSARSNISVYYKIAYILMVFGFIFNTSCSNNNKNRPNSLEENDFFNINDSIVKYQLAVVISSYQNKKVLDIIDGSFKNNAPVGCREFNGGLNQTWEIEKSTSGYIIRSMNTKKVLSINMTNSTLVQEVFNGKENQSWLISGLSDTIRIMNKALKKYLTIISGNITTENYTSSTAQQWQVMKLDVLAKRLMTCNCLENYSFIKQRIETSYSGFQDKVNTKTKSDYEKLVKTSTEQAYSTKNTSKCFQIIDNYLSFFNDGHIHFNMMNNGVYGFNEKIDPKEIRNFYANSESIQITEKDVKLYLNDKKKTIAPLEGIWETSDKTYRCAIIKDKNDFSHFIGIILNADSIFWMPGQIKMDFYKKQDNWYSLYYNYKNHTTGKQNVNYLNGDTLFEGNSKWIKEFPANTGTKTQLTKNAYKYAEWFQLKPIDEMTNLLSLPSFDNKYKYQIDNILNDNRNKILSTPYLIIDIRENGGGVDETFRNILPLMYTNQFATIGNDILASKENINEIEQQLKSGAIKLENQELVRSLIRKMKNSYGRFVEFSNDKIVKYNEVTNNPRKIVILIDNHCASSAEQFLLFAKESKKVILMGQNTSGTLDYSNVITVKCPNPVFNFGYAITRSHRLPAYSVDKDKIKPDIYLTDNQDWIKEAVKQLKKTDK